MAEWFGIFCRRGDGNVTLVYQALCTVTVITAEILSRARSGRVFSSLEMVPVSCVSVTGRAPSQGLEGEFYPLSGAVGLGRFAEGTAEAPWAAAHHQCINSD